MQGNQQQYYQQQTQQQQQQQQQPQQTNGYPSRPMRPMARPIYAQQARPVRPTTIPDGDSPTSPANLVQPMSQLNVQHRPPNRAKRVYQDAYNTQQPNPSAQMVQPPLQQGYSAAPVPQNGAYTQQPSYAGGYTQPSQQTGYAPSTPFQQQGGYSQPSQPYPQAPSQPSYPQTPQPMYPSSPGQGQPVASGYPQQPQQQQPARSKIDPDQIPSPIAVQEADQELFKDNLFDTGACLVPPLASTYFAANAYASCNPRFMRLTLNQLPCTDEILNQSGLPMGLVVEPLANLDPRDVIFMIFMIFS